MMFRMFPYIILVALSSYAAFAQDPNTIFLPSSVAADTIRANQMSSSAHLRLGYKYLSGLAGTMDRKQAAQHFAAAAAQNVSAASAWLGYTYVMAPELGHSAREGVALIQQAANAGDPVGQTLLGHLYQNGRGLAQDLISARSLYLAAGQKFALAWRYLAEISLATPDQNVPGSDVHYVYAQLLLRNAATKADTTSMVLLADIYASGRGVPKDLTQSVGWVRRAAQRGDPIAMYRLGGFYRDGWVVSKSQRMAAFLFRRSANAGYAPAQAALGVCYLRGTGVGKDTAHAIQWLKEAEPNDKYAANLLATLNQR